MLQEITVGREQDGVLFPEIPGSGGVGRERLLQFHIANSAKVLEDLINECLETFMRIAMDRAVRALSSPCYCSGGEAWLLNRYEQPYWSQGSNGAVYQQIICPVALFICVSFTALWTRVCYSPLGVIHCKQERIISIITKPMSDFQRLGFLGVASSGKLGGEKWLWRLIM